MANRCTLCVCELCAEDVDVLSQVWSMSTYQNNDDDDEHDEDDEKALVKCFTHSGFCISPHQISNTLIAVFVVFSRQTGEWRRIYHREFHTWADTSSYTHIRRKRHSHKLQFCSINHAEKKRNYCRAASSNQIAIDARNANNREAHAWCASESINRIVWCALARHLCTVECGRRTRFPIPETLWPSTAASEWALWARTTMHPGPRMRLRPTMHIITRLWITHNSIVFSIWFVINAENWFSANKWIDWLATEARVRCTRTHPLPPVADSFAFHSAWMRWATIAFDFFVLWASLFKLNEPRPHSTCMRFDRIHFAPQLEWMNVECWMFTCESRPQHVHTFSEFELQLQNHSHHQKLIGQMSTEILPFWRIFDGSRQSTSAYIFANFSCLLICCFFYSFIPSKTRLAMNINYFDFGRTSLEHLAKRLPNECGRRKVMDRATANSRVKGTPDRTCVHIIIHGFVQFSNFRSASQFIIGHWVIDTIASRLGLRIQSPSVFAKRQDQLRIDKCFAVVYFLRSFSLIKTNNLKINTRPSPPTPVTWTTMWAIGQWRRACECDVECLRREAIRWTLFVHRTPMTWNNDTKIENYQRTRTAFMHDWSRSDGVKSTASYFALPIVNLTNVYN